MGKARAQLVTGDSLACVADRRFLASGVCPPVGEAGLEACAASWWRGWCLPTDVWGWVLALWWAGPCLAACLGVSVGSLVFRQPVYWFASSLFGVVCPAALKPTGHRVGPGLRTSEPKCSCQEGFCIWMSPVCLPLVSTSCG